MIVWLSGCVGATREEKAASLVTAGIGDPKTERKFLEERSAILVSGSEVSFHKINFGFFTIVPQSVSREWMSSRYFGSFQRWVSDEPHSKGLAKYVSIYMGMACAIAPGDRYVTAAHCLNRPPYTILRIDADGEVHSSVLEILWRDETRDIAMLKSEDEKGLPFFEITKKPVLPGDSLTALGNFSELSAGKVLVNIEKEDYGFLHSSIPLRPGDSGGPIVNSEFELCGIASSISISPWSLRTKWTKIAPVNSADLSDSLPDYARDSLHQ